MADQSSMTPAAPNLVDKAIARGAELAREEEDRPIELPLTREEESRLNELCDLLGLSVRALLNTAVKYTIFHVESKRLEAKSVQVSRQIPPGDAQIFRFETTAETDQKLRESDMTQYVRECAAAGIDLLHERLIRPAEPSEKAA